MAVTTKATDASAGIGAEDQAPRRPERPGFDGSCALRNYVHEQFAQEVARLSEQDALGKAGEDACVAVGFSRHRHNGPRKAAAQSMMHRTARGVESLTRKWHAGIALTIPSWRRSNTACYAMSEWLDDGAIEKPAA